MLGNFATCRHCGHSIDGHGREKAGCGLKACSCTGFALAEPVEELKGAAFGKLARVVDAQSFLAFARALVAERALTDALETMNPSKPYGPDALGWENGSIWAFLERAVGWAEDSEFGKRLGLSENPWHLFASFLYAGKIYE